MTSNERQDALQIALENLSNREREIMRALLELLELEAADSSSTYPVAKVCAKANMKLSRVK